jgi:GNAT superfamily N-acetyltransferase
MEPADVAGVVALQPLAFPPPFDPALLWSAEHIESHLATFPEGQWVAVHSQEGILGSCSNTRISRGSLEGGDTWEETVGGPFLQTFLPHGEILYGLDISVHPGFRRHGIGRALYQERFRFVRSFGLAEYATSCRLPGFRASGVPDLAQYAEEVAREERTDATLTPLLRIGLTYRGVAHNFMHDEESGHGAAKLGWRP